MQKVVGIFLCAILPLISAGPGAAQETQILGVGRLFNNDRIGDGQDRWRSGSYVLSVLRGSNWEGRAPAQPGGIIEYRLRSEIIAPRNLNGPGSQDRAYVGALSVGVHTHFSAGGADLSFGLDTVVLGPRTGLADFQTDFHDWVSAPTLGANVVANQVQNDAYLTGLVEMSYPVALADGVSFRPFVQAQYGVEDLARIGGDLIIGAIGHDDLWLRDVVTGQLYAGVEGPARGTSFVLGADFAAIDGSAYFPASFGTLAQDRRFRARAGLHARLGQGWSLFYGATYLGEEYQGQDEGQWIGSVHVRFSF